MDSGAEAGRTPGSLHTVLEGAAAARGPAETEQPTPLQPGLRPPEIGHKPRQQPAFTARDQTGRRPGSLCLPFPRRTWSPTPWLMWRARQTPTGEPRGGCWPFGVPHRGPSPDLEGASAHSPLPSRGPHPHPQQPGPCSPSPAARDRAVATGPRACFQEAEEGTPRPVHGAQPPVSVPTAQPQVPMML